MKTIRLAEGIAADYDKDGRLSGLEILDAEKRFDGKDTLRHVEVEGVEFDRPMPIAVDLVEGRAASSPFFQVQFVANWFFALKRQPPPKQPLLVTVHSLDGPSTERVLIDPNQIDAKGTTSRVVSRYGRNG